ncbi:hypothetical protein ACI7YT_12540 [Microbacterium sp. M]|uniref:hypothetical protein n=1 Tax=Microbacterium sp. M TaxID=3377125 RepID=UPI00387052E9
MNTASHALIPTADSFRRAARASVKITPNSDGTRPRDPLRHVIPGDGQATAEALAIVRNITGRVIANGTGSDAYQNTAPAARAALRRWALLNGENA